MSFSQLRDDVLLEIYMLLVYYYHFWVSCLPWSSVVSCKVVFLFRQR